MFSCGLGGTMRWQLLKKKKLGGFWQIHTICIYLGCR